MAVVRFAAFAAGVNVDGMRMVGGVHVLADHRRTVEGAEERVVQHRDERGERRERRAEAEQNGEMPVPAARRQRNSEGYTQPHATDEHSPQQEQHAATRRHEGHSSSSTDGRAHGTAGGGADHGSMHAQQSTAAAGNAADNSEPVARTQSDVSIEGGVHGMEGTKRTREEDEQPQKSQRDERAERRQQRQRQRDADEQRSTTHRRIGGNGANEEPGPTSLDENDDENNDEVAPRVGGAGGLGDRVGVG